MAADFGCAFLTRTLFCPLGRTEHTDITAVSLIQYSSLSHICCLTRAEILTFSPRQGSYASRVHNLSHGHFGSTAADSFVHTRSHDRCTAAVGFSRPTKTSAYYPVDEETKIVITDHIAYSCLWLLIARYCAEHSTSNVHTNNE